MKMGKVIDLKAKQDEKAWKEAEEALRDLDSFDFIELGKRAYLDKAENESMYFFTLALLECGDWDLDRVMDKMCDVWDSLEVSESFVETFNKKFLALANK